MEDDQAPSRTVRALDADHPVRRREVVAPAPRSWTIRPRAMDRPRRRREHRHAVKRNQVRVPFSFLLNLLLLYKDATRASTTASSCLRPTLQQSPHPGSPLPAPRPQSPPPRLSSPLDLSCGRNPRRHGPPRPQIAASTIPQTSGLLSSRGDPVAAIQRELAQHKISARIFRPLRWRAPSSGNRRGSNNINKGILVSLRDCPPRWGRLTRATLPVPYRGGGTLMPARV
jgi:hypothetical protein